MSQQFQSLTAAQAEIDRLTALLVDVEEDRDARRQSLANEIRGVLKTRGYFAPDRPSDLIGAVARALDAAKAEGRESEQRCAEYSDCREIPSLPGTTQEAEEVFARWKGAPYVTRDPQRDPHERGALRDVCVAGIVCGLHAARQIGPSDFSIQRNPDPRDAASHLQDIGRAYKTYLDYKAIGGRGDWAWRGLTQELDEIIRPELREAERQIENARLHGFDSHQWDTDVNGSHEDGTLCLRCHVSNDTADAHKPCKPGGTSKCEGCNGKGINFDGLDRIYCTRCGGTGSLE